MPRQLHELRRLPRRTFLFAGWDESTKFGDSVFAMTFLIEHFDGSREEVCLRGLTLLPAGGTSKAILEHIETRIFAHARRILGLWIREHEKETANGAGSWAAAGGPPIENIGLHRLSEDTVLMTDTCNAARCTKRLLGEAIMRTMQEKIGAEAWEAMSVEERNAKFRFYRADCWQHLRNILIEAMSQAGTACLKDTLSESLEQFSSFERIEVDAKAIIRAAFIMLYKLIFAAKRCGLALLVFEVGHKAKPDKLPLLTAALELQGAVRYVDFALELPLFI